MFCLQCGASLTPAKRDGRWRDVCPACGWVYYPQLKVGAAALILRGGRLLLLKRARPPWEGDWYLPAGYVEADESPHHAAERETYEETGLRVRAARLLDAIYFDDDPRGNGILLVYVCKILSGEITGNVTEVSAWCFFSPGEIPANLTGAGHATAIRNWLAGRYQIAPARSSCHFV